MAKITVLSQSGSKVKDLELKDEIFNITPNKQAIYDVVNLQRAAMRQGTHAVKNRSEVSGGGKKPWRQKGTGRARQGSIRAPQWRGGGVVFGPTPERNYKFKLNKKVKQLALRSSLSYKLQSDKLVAVDTIKFDVCRTKDFKEFLTKVNSLGKTLVVCSKEELTSNAVYSARNLSGVFLTSACNASVYEILCFDKLVLTEAAVKHFEEVLR